MTSFSICNWSTECVRRCESTVESPLGESSIQYPFMRSTIVVPSGMAHSCQAHILFSTEMHANGQSFQNRLFTFHFAVPMNDATIKNTGTIPIKNHFIPTEKKEHSTRFRLFADYDRVQIANSPTDPHSIDFFATM